MTSTGHVVENSLGHELLELHCNYQARPCLSTLGGHFQQLYLVIAAIYEQHPEEELQEFYHRKNTKPNDDSSKKALTPRELTIE